MLVIDLESPIPIVEQIARGIRCLIAQSALAPGAELPSVRQLAADLGVNLNTVARAYRALESDGLVVTQRGRGTRVRADSETLQPGASVLRDRVRAGLRDLVADAKLAGAPRALVEKLAGEVCAEFWPSGPSERSSST